MNCLGRGFTWGPLWHHICNVLAEQPGRPSCVLWPWSSEFICSHWFLALKPLDNFLEPADNQAGWVRLSFSLLQLLTQANRFSTATFRGVTYWPRADIISLLTKQNRTKLLWLMPGPFFFERSDEGTCLISALFFPLLVKHQSFCLYAAVFSPQDVHCVHATAHALGIILIKQRDQDDRCQGVKVISFEILTFKISRNVSDWRLIGFFSIEVQFSNWVLKPTNNCFASLPFAVQESVLLLIIPRQWVYRLDC